MPCRYLVYALFLFVKPLASIAQARCGFNEANEVLFRIDPSAKSRFEEQIQINSESSPSDKLLAVPLYTIPVVFHVIHQGGPENISDAQIMDALAILNRDFNKENADTVNIVSPFQSIASDCNIEFRLATLDEYGNCTTGITRHFDPVADWVVSVSSYKYTWNRTRYLNIYVVKSLPPGVAAYTFLPGTASALMDAVVALHSYVGTIGTAWPGGSRSLTHEVGHWLNLQHTWGSTNQPGVACGDDGVGDTPITKGFGFCNLSASDQCQAGVPENVQNFMEYSFCSSMYTLGQRNRMHNALNSSTAGRINLWSPANLVFTGVFNSPLNCAPKADFAPNTAVACQGDTVNFTDYSYNAPVTSWHWSSPSSASSSQNAQGKLVFNMPGPAQVRLKVGNAYGSDSIVKTNLIILPSAVTTSSDLSQGFENQSFPNTLWLGTQAAYGGSFLVNNLSAHSGTACLWLNNFYDNPSEAVSFFSPRYTFQSFSPSQLSFYYAYAQKSSASNDRFSVRISNDCGMTWYNLLSLQGASLSTTGSASNTAFFPSVSDYSLVSLDLSAFSNQAIYLRFEFKPDPAGPGNNFFIDDINLSGLTSLNTPQIADGIRIGPNPFQKSVSLTGLPAQTCYISLQDLSSRILLETESRENTCTLTCPSELKDGFYVLSIQGSGFRKCIKLVKSE
ncbi:MAG TPA: M43 family zinc metalloprotease [Bacteroidia bacterium]|nr:M43 family zinc metalloprotease [Bacteroidia bacterium]